MNKKLLGLFAGLAFALSVMVVPVVKAEIPDLNELSTEQLIAMISELLKGGSGEATETTNETPATGATTSIAGIPQGFQFNTNLKLGMNSNDVKYLQIVLNSDPATTVANTGAGSKGNETTYFGGLTKQAVVKFQEKYATAVLTPFGLTKGTGLVGTTTRAKLNEIVAQGATTTPTDVSGLSAVDCVTQGYKWDGKKCYTDQLPSVDVSKLGMLDCVTQGYAWDGTKCYNPNAGDTPGTPVVTPVEGAGMEVALASDSPATSLVTGQSAAPLAKFVLTNKDSVSAKVTKVELQRTGVSADATLANVYLFDGLARLTDAATVSQGKITFNNPNGVVTVPAGHSVVVTVASDIAGGSAAGQTLGVSLAGLTSNIEVKSLPVQGHIQTIANAELAEVQVGAVTPAETSVSAGTTNFTVFQVPLTITKRAVDVKAVNLKAIGSIPTDALENIQLYINGTAVGSSIALASDGMATFVLDTPQQIQGSATLEVRADIVKGSSRNFSFSLQNAADLIAVDADYNVYTKVTGVPKTTGLVTISEGTVSVSQDSEFSATTVASGVSNVTLAKFNFKAFGEDVKVSYLDVRASQHLNNLSIYVNGAPVTSNMNYTGTDLHFSLGSSLVIPAGKIASVEVRGDTKNASGNITNNSNVKITLVKFDNNAQGVSSSRIFTVPSANVEGQSLTAGEGGLTIAKRTSFADSNISPNADNQKIGSFTVQASDSEAVKINNFNVKLDGASTVDVKQLSNLYIKYGSSETTPNPSVHSNNNLSTSGVVVPAGESMNVDVYVSVGNVQQQTTTSSAEIEHAFTKTDEHFTVAIDGTILTGDKFKITLNDVNANNTEDIDYTVVAEDDTTEKVAQGIATALKATTGTMASKILNAVATNNTIFVVLASGHGIDSIASNVTKTTTSVTVSPKLQATLGVSATGVSSNTTLNVTERTGQIITVATAGLSAPELSSTSAPSQFVLGDSTAQAAKYSFIATGGSVTIQKLKFTVTNPEAIESITIDGKEQTVYSNTVNVTGLSINVPETRSSGVDVEVKAKYNEIGTNRDSIKGVKLTLTEVEYKAGNTTKTMDSTALGGGKDSNPMYIVAGYPKVELKKVSNSSLADGKVRVAEVAITSKGNKILLKELPIKVTLSGQGAFDASNSKIYAEGSLGSGTPIAVGDQKSGEGVIVFPGGIEIDGTTATATFNIYVDSISGTQQYDKLTTSLGNKATFKFEDVEGGTTISADNNPYLLKDNYDELESVEISY